MAQYKIIDSKGFLLPETVRKVYSQIERTQPTNKVRPADKIQCTLQELDDFECQAYVTLSFQSGGLKYTINRKYKSLLETIGDIGGINEITLFIAGMIYYLFHQVAVKKFLVWQVFQFKKEPTKVKKNKSKNSSASKDQPSIPPNTLDEQQLKIEPDEGYSVKLVTNQVLEDAWDTIDNTLDVVSISRDLCAIRSILRILLDQNQKVRLTRVNVDHQKLSNSISKAFKTM